MTCRILTVLERGGFIWTWKPFAFEEKPRQRYKPREINPRYWHGKEPNPASFKHPYKGYKKQGILVMLKTVNGVQQITDLQRVSRPGCRRYTKVRNIPRVKGGLGTVVLSTPMGLLTDSEAREHNVGGELLFTIW